MSCEPLLEIVVLFSFAENLPNDQFLFLSLNGIILR